METSTIDNVVHAISAMEKEAYSTARHLILDVVLQVHDVPFTIAAQECPIAACLAKVLKFLAPLEFWLGDPADIQLTEFLKYLSDAKVKQVKEFFENISKAPNATPCCQMIAGMVSLELFWALKVIRLPIKLLRTAALRGNACAQWALWNMWRKLSYDEKHMIGKEEAMNYLATSEAQGFVPAICDKAMYDIQYDIQNDTFQEEKLVALIRTGANKGYDKALDFMMRLAQITGDAIVMREWQRKAALHGSAYDMYQLGIYYMGVDNTASYYWLRMATDVGNIAAKEKLNQFF